VADTDVPQTTQQPIETPRIGVDEWVAQQELRLEEGLLGRVRALGGRMPWWTFLGGATAVGVLVGALSSSGFVLQVGFDTLIFVMLALGLNVVVGWAGLLDLGYVVFLGVGAYGYAWLASSHFHQHWPAEGIVPVVVVGTALVGFLIGLTSWRLLGDYLAIVTLFMLQMFITFANNGDQLHLKIFDAYVFRQVNLTNGANGIHPLDAFNLFGWHPNSVRDYYFLVLGTAVLLYAALQLVNASRTGRAWRALREDPLAANLLSIPVNRLKLLAFVFGAAVGGLTGTIFAAAENAVFPPDFNLQKLILIYAMVILGGAGSLPGVVIGAIIVNVSDRLLTTPEHARVIFYAALLFGLLAAGARRRWGPRWVAAIAAATVGAGFAVHAIASAVWPAGVHGQLPGSGGLLADTLSHWVLVPSDPYNLGRYGYGLLVALVVSLTFVRGYGRRLLVVPLLYVAACVWENVLVGDPSTTRLIILGAMLVALMNLRPAGLLGTARVEIV
jgi:ABC-type branched-subunit amino acid transport system permease subunit